MSTTTHTVTRFDGSEYGMTFAGTPAAVAYGQSHKNVQTITTDRGTIEYEASPILKAVTTMSNCSQCGEPTEQKDGPNGPTPVHVATGSVWCSPTRTPTRS